MANSCAICGKFFVRRYDLKRHQNTVHFNEMSSRAQSESEQSDDEKPKADGGEESDGTDRDENVKVTLEDNPVYCEWYDQAVEDTQEARKQKYVKYVNEGMDPAEAKEKAYWKTLWAIKRNFFDSFGTFLKQKVELNDDDTYQEIISEIEADVVEMDVVKAVKRNLPKYKHHFEAFFRI